ncbi:P-loop containing nucleoside triphosphate hydrolase protein [Cubamyces sp. BRFM 1775]|nr:P-loop containing nucleoside triphosphate hydrolase protein [Cubamyces sp. BRFM 1775]
MDQTKAAASMKDLEDAFIKVTFEEDSIGSGPQTGVNAEDPFYDSWVDQASGKFADPAQFGARQLRKLYPDHSIVAAYDGNINILGFPGAFAQPLSPSDIISTIHFVPLARRLSRVPGVLVDSISFGAFRLAWDKYDFLLYVIRYPFGFGQMTQHFILHKGSEEPARSFLIAAGAWSDQLHNEVLVFDSGSWQKSRTLWSEVQKANWADVILKDEFKAALKKDLFGFFDSEELYKSLAIPWKRGIIMYGPPGNGKTISLKAVMKDCDARGYAPLYVKSFRSWRGEEGSMSEVFSKARQMAPCVLILEDLDALINDGNRSFFLNQLDGLEGNDGILLIGTTNHFDRLDPALNNRPSRFDRKYLFDDPDEEERTLYIQYWQNKLKNNKDVDFPDSLVKEVASKTSGFSFAYLKEAFVSSLVLLAGHDGDDKPEFKDLLLEQVKVLRKQLDKDKDTMRSFDGAPHAAAFARGTAGVSAPSSGGRLPQIDPRSIRIGQPSARIWDTSASTSAAAAAGRMPGAMPDAQREGFSSRRDVRAVASAAAALGRSFIS